jgi:hypothetical protein
LEEKTDGSDLESPDDDQAALDALVGKYNGDKKLMAGAIRGMQSLQNKTAEEKKEIQDRLNAAAEVLDTDYNWVDGKPVLKAEVAARHLRSQRKETQVPFRVPTEAEIRENVEGQFRERAIKLVGEDQADPFMAEMKSVIDQTVADKLQSAKIAVETQRTNMRLAVGEMIGNHLAAHPDDKNIMGEIDQIYAGMPEEVRIIAFLEDWVPLGQIAELVRLKKDLPKIVKDAYSLGKQHRGKEATLTEAGAPGKSRPTPHGARGTARDAVSEFKNRVLAGTGLASLDSIVGSR